ncbi:MAG: hypothetical protein ACYCO9_21340 [Streptosporangiaceae bacterium]
MSLRPGTAQRAVGAQQAPEIFIAGGVFLGAFGDLQQLREVCQDRYA